MSEITLESGLGRALSSQELQIQALKRQKEAITQKTKQVRAQQQVQKAQAKLSKAMSSEVSENDRFLTLQGRVS